MSNTFSTCLLVQNGSLAPELERKEINLHPGDSSSFSVDQGKTIMLAGGFSSITPESGFPLSSTLLLNADLASLSDEQLLQVANAEVNRLHSINYRSYSVDADNRVCVISNNSKQLAAFIETYGGILEIEPLLVKGYHPDFPTVTELELTSKKQGCLLEYQLRSPIMYEQCTYCGACGPSCPEKCISETLFVNYDLCTFCKECEKVCPVDAIDIYSAVNRKLEVPAVIILGDLEIGEAGKHVYYERYLADYFANLYPCQIDEVVTCNKSICQYSGNKQEGCQLCRVSCTFGAITQGAEGVVVDSLLCEECGACVAVCPTGAMQYERFSDKAFVDYLATVDLPSSGTVVLGAEEQFHKVWWNSDKKKYENVFFLQYDNVHSLSVFHYLQLVKQGAGKVVVLTESGEESNKAGASTFIKQLATADILLKDFFDVENVFEVVAADKFSEWIEEPLRVSVLPEKKQRGTDSGSSFLHRRQSLAESLSLFTIESGKEITLKPEYGLSHAVVTCHEDRCTHCMACLNECKIEALTGDEEKMSLDYTGALCVGCTICVKVCPEDALVMSREVKLTQTYFEQTVLAKADPMACKSCGKVFGTKKSFERVMAILKQKEDVDTSHFEYCETCRVVKLFDSE